MKAEPSERRAGVLLLVKNLPTEVRGSDGQVTTETRPWLVTSTCDGKEQTRKVEAEDGSLSADGTRLAYLGLEGEPLAWKFMVLEPGGAKREVERVSDRCHGQHCTVFALDWSPADSRIAYKRHWRSSGFSQTLDVDNFETHQVNSSESATSKPRWSWDGRNLYLVSRDTFRVNLADGKTTKILDFSAEVAESPDGLSIAFAKTETRCCGEKGEEGLFIANNDGTGQRLVHPTGRSPQFSPDGKRIAFTVKSGSKDQVWVVDADGTGPRMAIDDAAVLDWAAAAPGSGQGAVGECPPPPPADTQQRTSSRSTVASVPISNEKPGPASPAPSTEATAKAPPVGTHVLDDRSSSDRPDVIVALGIVSLAVATIGLAVRLVRRAPFG